MEGQTVYTTFDILDEIFAFAEDSDYHKLLSNIIAKYSDVMIDIEEEEFDRLMSDKQFNIIKLLKKRVRKHTYSLKPYFDNIHDENLSHNPRDIFLLNEDDDFCENAMNKFGVFVVNCNSLEKIQLLSKKYQKSFEKGETYAFNKNNKKLIGWSAFISNINVMPLNSIVLIDNHIFNNIDSGKENLLSLFGSLLPNKLNSTFHILIIIENRDARHSMDSLLSVHKEIEEKLNGLVDYTVEVCIISHPYSEEFHNRVLLTNYHMIKAQYGFDMFHNKKVKRTDEPEFLSVYYTIDEKEGDSEIKTAEKKIRLVQKLVERIDAKTDLIIGNFFSDNDVPEKRRVRNKLIDNF